MLFKNKSFHEKYAKRISKLSDFGKVAIENSTVYLALSILGLFLIEDYCKEREINNKSILQIMSWKQTATTEHSGATIQWAK